MAKAKSHTKTTILTVNVELPRARIELAAAEGAHAAAVQQWNDALDAVTKARAAREVAAKRLDSAQEACLPL